MTTTIKEKQLKAITEIKKFYPISEDEINKLQSFVELLLTFNEHYNLIGNSTKEEIWHRHILDCAQILKYIKNNNLVIGDFGSGAGLPGIILSILGNKEVHLIEKSFRKCQFLKLAAEISSNRIIIHQKKAEEIKGLSFDIATSRAFAPLDVLLPIVKPFFKPNSYAIFLKGKNFENEILIAKKNYSFYHQHYPTITSAEGRILIINI